MLISLYTNERSNVDTSAAPATFAGGVMTVHFTLHSAHGTEVASVWAKPTGGAGTFKQVAEIFSAHAHQPIDVELVGEHQVYGVLTGADPSGAATPATSNTDATLELSAA